MYFALVLMLLACQSQPLENGTIPHTNRPRNFSGAAGSYRLEVNAEPVRVRVEDPITLTVKIVSLQGGPWPHPPQRDKLQLWPAGLETDFFVEAVPELDRFVTGENAWEFVWRLMPKHERVQTIPALDFAYYHTEGAQGFKVAEGARSLPLKVRPRPGLLIAAPSDTRARFRELATGHSLLTRSQSPAARFNTLIAALALPPALCFAGYFLWQQLFPSAARRLGRRRSRGLKSALKQLHRLGLAATPAQIRVVLANYLRLHVDLPPGGPTPPDVKNALLQRGMPADLAGLAEKFVRRCDAAIFAPAAPGSTTDFQAGARQLLRQLEAALCASSSP